MFLAICIVPVPSSFDVCSCPAIHLYFVRKICRVVYYSLHHMLEIDPSNALVVAPVMIGLSKKILSYDGVFAPDM